MPWTLGDKQGLWGDSVDQKRSVETHQTFSQEVFYSFVSTRNKEEWEDGEDRSYFQNKHSTIWKHYTSHPWANIE